MERIIDRKLLTSTRICALVLLLAAGYFASSVLIPFVTDDERASLFWL
jgi:hypothetical protein